MCEKSWGVETGNEANYCPFRKLILLFAVCLQVREERFRQVSDSTNARVLWWSLGQSIVLILMGVWQMRHLKSFFEAKKLV